MNLYSIKLSQYASVTYGLKDLERKRTVATVILNVVCIRYRATRIKENTAFFTIHRREKGEQTKAPDSPAWRRR
jgi:hypothetical protein